MLYGLLADTVVVVHFAFIVYVVLGALLVWRWPWTAWLHLPVVAWGALVELMGWTCPLTPLEVHLRTLAGGGGYEGGFIAHYLLPVIYPPGLTPGIQVVLGLAVLAINGVLYGVLLWRRRARVRRDDADRV
ncbi:MAG: DUF2784 domain-containing protein [Gammaproteobacteria bacterium]|nr:DUF2784 domain-containing protein [Gammaproteobacteria bacterium]